MPDQGGQVLEVWYDCGGTVETETHMGQRVRRQILPDQSGWVRVDDAPKVLYGRVFRIGPPIRRATP